MDMDIQNQPTPERALNLEDSDEVESLPPDSHEQAGPNDFGTREDGAPRYTVPPRAMGAVEIPMIVADVDRATRAFGNVGTFKSVSRASYLSGSPSLEVTEQCFTVPRP